MSGTKFIGTESIVATTKAQTELVTKGYELYRVELTVLLDTVIVVNGTRLMVGAGRTFKTDHNDARITSLIVEGIDKSYHFIGAI